MILMRDEYGVTVYLAGRAAVFNELSQCTLQDCGERREVIRPGAFDFMLGREMSCRLEQHHLGKWTAAASCKDGNLELWSNHNGLFFRAGPFEANSMNQEMLRNIVRGDRGMSWLGKTNRHIDDVNGESVVVVESFYYLNEISVCDEGAYAGARCWLSSEPDSQLPAHVREIRDQWRDSYNFYRIVSKPSPRGSTAPSLNSKPSPGRSTAASPNNAARKPRRSAGEIVIPAEDLAFFAQVEGEQQRIRREFSRAY